METIGIINDYNKNKQLLNELKRKKRNLKKPPRNNKNFIFSLLHISQLFLIIGGLGWGIVSFFELYNKNGDGFDNIKSIIMGLIGCSSLFMITTNGIKPSFIGDYVLPPTSVYESYPRNYNIVYELETSPNSTIIYWAAKKSKNNSVKTKEKAYGKFENSGVTNSNEYGIAKIYLQYPSTILTNDFVPRVMNKHFSYRILNKQTGILSDIMTEDMSDYCSDNVLTNEQPIPLNNIQVDQLNNLVIPPESMEPIIV